MTRIEANEVLLKRDVGGFRRFLLDGNLTTKELLRRLPLYMFPKGLSLYEEDCDLDIDVSMAGILGFMTTIYFQTEGDCLFGIEDHPDGSGDGLLHTFFYVSEESHETSNQTNNLRSSTRRSKKTGNRSN